MLRLTIEGDGVSNTVVHDVNFDLAYGSSCNPRAHFRQCLPGCGFHQRVPDLRFMFTGSPSYSFPNNPRSNSMSLVSSIPAYSLLAS